MAEENLKVFNPKGPNPRFDVYSTINSLLEENEILILLYKGKDIFEASGVFEKFHNYSYGDNVPEYLLVKLLESINITNEQANDAIFIVNKTVELKEKYGLKVYESSRRTLLYWQYLKGVTDDTCPWKFDGGRILTDREINMYCLGQKPDEVDAVELEESLSPKDNIKEPRILRLISDCVRDVRQLTYRDINFDAYDWDLYKCWGESKNTFGTMSYPEYPGAPFTLTLNKHMINESDDAIKNVIYHELAHYIQMNYLFDLDIIYWDIGDKLKATKEYRTQEYKSHGTLWKGIAKEISKNCNTDITRTNTYELHTGVGEYAKQKDAQRKDYTVTCNGCGAKLHYHKATEFVKDPNMTEYEHYMNTKNKKFYLDYFKNNPEREAKAKNTVRFYCTRCGARDWSTDYDKN